jgi:hypothetical protein
VIETNFPARFLNVANPCKVYLLNLPPARRAGARSGFRDIAR